MAGPRHRSRRLEQPLGPVGARRRSCTSPWPAAPDLEDAARRHGEIGPFAGNGREDIVDGPLLPGSPTSQTRASFAQPSGLASDGKWLYVADSEGSSIRAVPFDATKN